jgi:hypothetical protein
MQSASDADQWFAQHGLLDVPRFSDPQHHLYRAFDLQDGSLFELAHPRVWKRWLSTALTRGAGMQGRHWRQLTGVFVVQGADVLSAVRHRNSAARPDYLALVQQASIGR